MHIVLVKVVTILGKQKAIELFEEARTIEQEGGMLIMVGSCYIYYCISLYFYIVLSN